MDNLWEKVKQTVEEGAKAIKESAESAAKSVAEKAPGIASTFVEKGKELADTIGDKAQEMVTLGQLKLKHYNLNRDVSNLFNEIGGKVYEIIKKDQKDFYTDANVMKMINAVKNLESQIDELEKKMEEVKKSKVTEIEEKSKPTEEAKTTEQRSA